MLGAKKMLVYSCSLAGVLQAQSLDLRGRVVANGSPVADAAVTLKLNGKSARTAADGTFAFSGSLALGKDAELPFRYRLESGYLALDNPTPRDLRIEVVDGGGRAKGSLARRVEKGSHRIALAQVMPDVGNHAGLYFLRMGWDGETLIHPFYHSGQAFAGTVFAPPYRRALASKRAAAVDTLRVTKAGYRDLVKEIASYTAGNLGDLSLVSASTDGWVGLFNGKDLTGWIPFIHKGGGLGVNYMDTFRADSVNKVIRVAYDKYGADGFNRRIGDLYYDKFLTNYRIRVTYRFLEPQATNPQIGWGRNNSALHIFGVDPRTIVGDPELHPLIEIQLCGNPSGGGTTSPNLCELNGMGMRTKTAACGQNNSGKAPNPANMWTTVEAEVRVSGQTKVYQLPDTTNPVFTMSGPNYNGQNVTGGYLALQSESQPIEFKDILYKDLPP